MQQTATCSCKQLSITLDDNPLVVSLCNCYDCQKRTGSVFGVSGYFDTKSIVNVSGKAQNYSRVGESGKRIEYHFCPTCGTTVFWYAECYADRVGVAVGCFADNTFPAPERAVYTKSKHAWVKFPDECKLYEGSPIKN